MEVFQSRGEIRMSRCAREELYSAVYRLYLTSRVGVVRPARDSSKLMHIYIHTVGGKRKRIDGGKRKRVRENERDVRVFVTRDVAGERTCFHSYARVWLHDSG